MIPETRKFALARGGALAALALAALLAACEASMPTAADVEKMDVAALEKSAKAARIGGMDDVQYFVNGKAVTAEEAHAIGAERIESIHVMKASMNADALATRLSQVRIVTKDAPGVVHEVVVDTGYVMRRITSGTLNGSTGAVGQGEVLFQTKAAGGAAAGEEARKIVTVRSDDPGAEPLFIIDGVESNAAALRALGPDRIESINVTKGATATEKYGTKGANGVILITTKK